MIARIATFSVLVLLSMLSVADAMAGGRQKGPGASSTSFSTPMRFVENKGQIVDQNGAPRRDIDFAVTSGDVTMFVGAHGFHYQFARQETAADGSSEDRIGSAGEMSSAPETSLTTLYRVDVALEGARPAPRVRTEGASSGYENYYNVPGVAGGVQNVRSHERVIYEDVYPGIDWVLYVDGDRVKYDFVVRMGGRVSDIRMRYAGASALLVEQGALRVTTPLGEIVEDAPTSWMEETGARVGSRFVVEGDVVRFETDALPGAGTLVIDPSVLWSTYYGGSNYDRGNGTVMTMANKTVLVGKTQSSSSIATTGAFRTSLSGSIDGFIAVFNASGQRLWATYYGGSSDDWFSGVDVDNATAQLVASGTTKSSSNVAFNGFDNSYGGNGDAMLVVFDSTGQRLWATYYGGSNTDDGNAVSCDQLGNVFLAGYTENSSGIATAGAQQTSYGGNGDGFVASFGLNGTRRWASYIGGSSEDVAYGVNGNPVFGDVFVVGQTYSSSGISTLSSFAGGSGGYNDYQGFVVMYSGSTGLRAWGRLIGGSGTEAATCVDSDSLVNVYVGGYTTSSSGIATSGAHQTSYGGNQDGFLTKYSSQGVRQWATYYGGSSSDDIQGVAWASGYVYAGGTTSSSSGIAATTHPLITLPRSTKVGGSDAFVASFRDGNGSRRWGTYYGGSSDDYCFGVHAVSQQRVAICGKTNSSSGISQNGHSNSYAGNYDAFQTVFDDPIVPVITVTPSVTAVCVGGSLTVNFTVSQSPANTGNVFTAQLSDATGSFATPTVLGTFSGVASGSIAAPISSSQMIGAGYRVRIVGSDPIVTSADNGVNISINPPPAADITASGSTTICAGTSVTLSAPAGTGYAYQWKRNGTNITGATAQSYVATLAGAYTVRVTSTSTSCVSETATATTVVVNPAPTAAITVSGNTTFCDGGSVTLNAGSQTGVTYVWLRNGSPIAGATTNTYAATLSGSYTVTVTNSFGCAATSTAIPVTVNPLPTATITAGGSTTLCAGTSVVLTANSGTGFTYQWKRDGANISGATSMTYTASVAGAYTVKVTNGATSCFSESAPTTVVVNPLPTAAITAGGPTTFCDGGSVVLSAGSQTGMAYEWKRNGSTLAGATSSTYTATLGGSYTVVVTNTTTSCVATSAPTTITVNPLPISTLTASGPTTFCAGGSVTLSTTAMSGQTYVWKRDGVTISGATAASYNATLSGAYTVTVTNGQNCSSTTATPIVVTANPLPTAVITAGGPTTFCDGASVVLSAGTQTGVSYEWKRNGTTIAGATSSTYTATLGGSYTVVVSSTSTSCSATSAAVTLTVNPLPVSTITASGPTSFCDGGSVTLSTPAASGQTYVWNRDGVAIAGATGSSYSTSISGSYTVTVTNGFNCSTTTATPVVVTVNPLPTANVTAGGPTTFCDGGSVTLTVGSGSGLTYQWLRNGSVIAGQTGSSYTATTSGSYQVSVTSGLNCSVTSSAVVVTANPKPQAVISSNGAPVSCEGSSVVLTTSTGSGYAYTWFIDGVEIAGAKSASFSASKTGSFTVRIATPSGCESTSAAFRVTINPLPTADVTVTGPTQFCAGESVQFRAASGSGYKYQWLRNGSTIAGATSATYVASLAGQYAVVVTDANQCSNTSSAITVTVEQAPTAAIEPPATTRLCTGASVTLKAVEGAGFTYQWRIDGRNIDGATSSTLNVSTAGSYGLVVTNQFGCSSVSPLVRITNVPYPSATITVDGPTALCPGGTVTLRAPVGVSVRYQWSRDGQPITGASAMTLVVTDPGTYSLLVTNSDGCGTQSPNPVTVSVSDYPDPKVVALGQTRFCEGFSVVLQADTRTATSFQWYRNGVMIPFATSSQVVATEAGVYTVEVANPAGCKAVTDPAAGVFVDVYKFLSPTIMANGPTNLCEGEAVVISTPQLSGVTYQWMENGVIVPGATGTTYTATRSGNYNVVVTTSNGCASTSSAVTVAVTPKPVATIALPKELTFCEGSSLDLLVETDCCCLTYEWSLNGRVLAGRNGKTLTVTESGTYTLASRDMVTGCYSEPFSITVTAVKPEFATVSASGPTQVCKGEVVTVTSTTVPGATYQWLRNGVEVPNATSTTLMVTADGVYSMAVRNSGGCTTVSNAVEVKYLVTPNMALGNIGPTTLCDGGSVTLVADSGAGFVYQWMKDGMQIAGATNASLTTNEKGVYSAMITAPSGCSVTTSSVEVRIVGIVNVGSVTSDAKGEVGKTSRFTVDNPIPGFLYSWQVTGGTILSGQTSPTIEVRWFAQGQQRVFVHATQLCSDTTVMSIAIDPATPITSVEGAAPESWSLYPNPAAGDVLLTIPEQARTRDLEVEVFSLLGASVHRERVAAGTATMQLRMSDLSVGMYRVTVRNDRELLLMKMLVKR